MKCSWSPYDFMVVRRAYGATDAKVTSSSLASSLSFLAEAGPTTKSQPPFSWSRFLKTKLVNSEWLLVMFRSAFSNSTPDFVPVDTFNFEAEVVRWARLGVNDQSGAAFMSPEGMNSGHICVRRSFTVICFTLILTILLCAV